VTDSKSRCWLPILTLLALGIGPLLEIRGQETPSRKPPREEPSPEQRAERIRELRALYSQPPEMWPEPHVDDDVTWRELGLLPEMEHPESNPYTEAKERLGKTLFFDPRLSGSGQMACASCHDPDLGWADGRTISFGNQRKPLARNAPTVRNSGFHEVLFWDGRATGLEDQARQVLLNPDEMHATEEHVTGVLKGIPEYGELFCEAFGDEIISFDRAAEALACFQRTIVGGRSRFDAFLKGKHDALSDEAISGLDLYRREARCMNCHHGPVFSDGKLHDVGLSYYGRLYEDLGRHRVTGAAEDVGKFRTPTLRDITSTAPYMHNGLFELPGVLNMYNAGMPTLKRKEEQEDDPMFPTKSPHLKSLGLNRQDLNDLLAFLKSLEEPKQRIRAPELPGLETNR